MSQGDYSDAQLEPERYLGIRMAEARENKHLSQSALGRMIEMKANQVSRYERGDALPATSQLRRISNALEVSPSWLVYGTDTPFEDSHPVSQRALSGSHREMVPVIAALLSMLDVDDRRMIASMVLRIVQLQHGDEVIRDAVAKTVGIQESMENDPDTMDLFERHADSFFDDSESNSNN
jgi:transcriptional regulator with XRE-family HTH domain